MAHNDIKQLLDLANVTNALGQPQQQQQQLQQQKQQQMMQVALSLLGLGQQQQENEAQRAATADYHQQVLGQQQSADAERSGQFWGGELPAKYAGQEAAATDAALNRDLTAQHYKAIEDAGAATEKNQSDANLIRALDLLGTPGVSPAAGDALSDRFPEIGGALEKRKTEDTAKLISRIAPTLKAAPNTIEAQRGSYDPAVFEQALKMAFPDGVPQAAPVQNPNWLQHLLLLTKSQEMGVLDPSYINKTNESRKKYVH